MKYVGTFRVTAALIWDNIIPMTTLITILVMTLAEIISDHANTSVLTEGGLQNVIAAIKIGLPICLGHT